MHPLINDFINKEDFIKAHYLITKVTSEHFFSVLAQIQYLHKEKREEILGTDVTSLQAQPLDVFSQAIVREKGKRSEDTEGFNTSAFPPKIQSDSQIFFESVPLPGANQP